MEDADSQLSGTQGSLSKGKKKRRRSSNRSKRKKKKRRLLDDDLEVIKDTQQLIDIPSNGDTPAKRTRRQTVRYSSASHIKTDDAGEIQLAHVEQKPPVRKRKKYKKRTNPPGKFGSWKLVDFLEERFSLVCLAEK